MLTFLEGVLVWVADDLIWLEVRGVGYEVHMHPNGAEIGRASCRERV